MEVYMPPFKAAVDAGAVALMPGFHDLAGIPMTAHKRVLQDLVRDEWGFDGLMISDYNAITELLAHGVAGDVAEAAAAALQAGSISISWAMPTPRACRMLWSVAW